MRRSCSAIAKILFPALAFYGGKGKYDTRGKGFATMRRWTKFLHNTFRVLADVHFLLLMLAALIFAVIEFFKFISRIAQ